ncbi:MAG: hypothetical protein J7D61_16035 [Marichromatium sp.]|nr:hypothetical protein [Marichromatium sp.]
MQQNTEPILAINYEDIPSKVFKSFFNYFILPLLLIVDIMMIYGFITHESLSDLSRPFALGVVTLVALIVYFFSIVIYFFSIKFLTQKYASLEIYKEKVIINNKDEYTISKVEFTRMPYMSVITRWFQLIDKESKEVIGHFVYRFNDTYFLQNSPEIIQKVINSMSIDKSVSLRKMVDEDKNQCFVLQHRNEKLRRITITAFLILIALITAMLLYRQS